MLTDNKEIDKTINNRGRWEGKGFLDLGVMTPKLHREGNPLHVCTQVCRILVRFRFGPRHCQQDGIANATGWSHIWVDAEPNLNLVIITLHDIITNMLFKFLHLPL